MMFDLSDRHSLSVSVQDSAASSDLFSFSVRLSSIVGPAQAFSTIVIDRRKYSAAGNLYQVPCTVQLPADEYLRRSMTMVLNACAGPKVLLKSWISSASLSLMCFQDSYATANALSVLAYGWPINPQSNPQTAVGNFTNALTVKTGSCQTELPAVEKGSVQMSPWDVQILICFRTWLEEFNHSVFCFVCKCRQ